jgi:hypothetical protein
MSSSEVRVVFDLSASANVAAPLLLRPVSVLRENECSNKIVTVKIQFCES